MKVFFVRLEPENEVFVTREGGNISVKIIFGFIRLINCICKNPCKYMR